MNNIQSNEDGLEKSCRIDAIDIECVKKKMDNNR